MSGRRDPKVEALRLRRPCPVCEKPSQRETYPFCSPRCKTIDLNRWLSGAYAIPVPEEEPDEALSSGGRSGKRRDSEN